MTGESVILSMNLPQIIQLFGQFQDSGVTYSVNQPAINHSVCWSVMTGESVILSMNLPQIIQLFGQFQDSGVSFSFKQPAINHSVSWSVPGQKSQLQSINQQYMHIIWSVGKSKGGRLESANQSINQRYISCKSFSVLVSSLTVESVT